MRFARCVFLIAGIYGILVLLPGLFVELSGSPTAAMGRPEFYYGFLTSALVWQAVFLIVASDPVRYTMIMLVAVFEKLAFFLPCMVLFALHRLAPGKTLAGALLDGVLMLLFAAAWWRCRGSAGARAEG